MRSILWSQSRPRPMPENPVCGMQVDLATMQHRADNPGHTYYSCCPACRRSFDAHPGQYLKK